MNYHFRIKLLFDEYHPFDVNYINRVCVRYPNERVLVEVPNTKYINTSMIRQLSSAVCIRIAGGYDDDRKRRFGRDIHWSSNYYEEAVIYTKHETIKILEEIEKIEAGMKKNWTDIQKLIYLYNTLKRKIMYDPENKNKLSSEVRSLRGLITKETVCAGYSMILKEFLDRQGIPCEYVEGYSKRNNRGGHAWNIVTIDGKKYPIDLTWDNS